MTTSAAPSPPIACSLTAGEYRRRTADTARLAGHALRTRELIAGGARLSFDPVPAVADELDAFVAAESQCCPFLQLDLRVEDGLVVLDVTGPQDAQPIIEALFA